MELMTGVDLPPAAEGTGQSRRDALKLFGRYAAAAPAAMVLLQAGESHAKPKRRRRPRGKGKGWRY